MKEIPPARQRRKNHPFGRFAIGGTTEEATFYANRPAGQDPGADVEVLRFLANESNNPTILNFARNQGFLIFDDLICD